MLITKKTHKKYQVKPFPHFDHRIQINKRVQKNLENPSYIATHSFYPFIHYTKITRKYQKDKTLSPPKKREIFYASHMDGYIFKYYGELLNHKYNNICKNKGIDHVSLAYRNNKNGKNNIHFAAEVIEFISKQQKAFIFVSDFSSYFDNLDHEILKKKLLTVLGDTPQLSKDWWNVFKHITQYNWVEKEELAKDLDLFHHRRVNNKNNRDRYYTPAEFRQFRKRVSIHKNNNKVGIPQGTAISAVLANVYAINLDEELNKYAEKFNGIYRRYSDDIILVFPISTDLSDQSDQHISFIKSVVESSKVEMGNSKTNTFYYQNKKIYKDIQCQITSRIDYLGFTYDGMLVKVREKSLFKYYHRMYKKIASVNTGSKIKKRKVGRKKLYSLYTHLGQRYKGYGNFISYCKKAHLIFSNNKEIESLIYKQIKRHWNKVQNRLLPSNKNFKK